MNYAGVYWPGRWSTLAPKYDRDRREKLLQQMADIKEEQLTERPGHQEGWDECVDPDLFLQRYQGCIYPATPGDSTTNFLCKHSEFVYRKGRPTCIVSYRGSYLVAGGIELAEKDHFRFFSSNIFSSINIIIHLEILQWFVAKEMCYLLLLDDISRMFVPKNILNTGT